MAPSQGAIVKIFSYNRYLKNVSQKESEVDYIFQMKGLPRKPHVKP